MKTYESGLKMSQMGKARQHQLKRKRRLIIDLKIKRGDGGHNKTFKNEEIIQETLIDFEKDFHEFVRELIRKNESPDTELKTLFKGLYFMFLQKPQYLNIVLNKELLRENKKVAESYFRIRSFVRKYLSKRINEGIQEHHFKTQIQTQFLVNRILESFKLLVFEEIQLSEIFK